MPRTNEEGWKEIFHRIQEGSIKSIDKPWASPKGFTYSDENLPKGSWWKARDVNRKHLEFFVASRTDPSITPRSVLYRDVVVQIRPGGGRYNWGIWSVIQALQSGIVPEE